MGVEALGVGALEPFFALSFWPPRRKLDEMALAPAIADVEVGAMEE